MKSLCMFFTPFLGLESVKDNLQMKVAITTLKGNFYINDSDVFLFPLCLETYVKKIVKGCMIAVFQ